MARTKKAKNDDDLMVDDIQEDFLEDTATSEETTEEWEDEQPTGQLALDIYETPKKLTVSKDVSFERDLS